MNELSGRHHIRCHDTLDQMVAVARGCLEGCCATATSSSPTVARQGRASSPGRDSGLEMCPCWGLAILFHEVGDDFPIGGVGCFRSIYELLHLRVELLRALIRVR